MNCIEITYKELEKWVDEETKIPIPEQWLRSLIEDSKIPKNKEVIEKNDDASDK